jgi:hypothetical protein
MTSGDASIYVLRARALLAEIERCRNFGELNYFLGGVLECREDAGGDQRTEAAMYSIFLNGALCALLSTKLDQERLNDVVERIVDCVVSDLQTWGATPETLSCEVSAEARSHQRWLVDRAARVASQAGTAHAENDRPVSRVAHKRSLPPKAR